MAAFKYFRTVRLHVGANQSLQDLPGVEDRRLRFAPPCNPPGNAPVGICRESNHRVAFSAAAAAL